MIKLFKKIGLILGIGVIGAVGVDVAIQTQNEVTDIIIIQQEECLQNTGKYCQFKKGKVNSDLFGTKVKEHDYEIIIDVWEGGKGELQNQQGYKIRYIELETITASST